MSDSIRCGKFLYRLYELNNRIIYFKISNDSLVRLIPVSDEDVDRLCRILTTHIASRISMNQIMRTQTETQTFMDVDIEFRA